MKKLLILALITCLGASSAFAAKAVLYERFDGEGAGGGAGADEMLTADSSGASVSQILSEMHAPTDAADGFRSRLTSYLIPPTTGEYTFWVASDDNGRLWLSTDEDPANAALIASHDSWTGDMAWGSAPQSDPIQLEAGKAYWIRAGMREGSGGDNLGVAWQGPGIDQQLITGEHLRLVPWQVEHDDQELVEYESWVYTWTDNNLPLTPNLEETALFPTMPTDTGLAPLFTHTIKPQEDGYTLRERGVIWVDEAKTIGLATYSDDGSLLWAGPLGGDLTFLVNNNGGHGGQYRGGSIYAQPGYLEVLVTMCEGSGGDTLSVYYWDANAQRNELDAGELVSATKASVPSPANATADVDPDAVLSWVKPWSIDNPIYKVYFADVDAEFGAPVAQGEGILSYDPELAVDGVYKWRVDIVDPNEGGTPVDVAGVTWSFATITSDIAITEQPTTVGVDAGAAATLSVAADSVLPLEYQWKKDGVDIAGATDSAYTIPAVAQVDEGTYSVVVSNANTSVESDAAQVFIKELVAYYPLDGDLLDHAGDHDAVFLVNDPNTLDSDIPDDTVPFITGKVGSAIEFNGADQFASAGTWNPSAGSGQLTLAFWARWNGRIDGMWQGMIAKRDTWAADNMMWQLELDQGSGYDMVKGIQQPNVQAGTGPALPEDDARVSLGGRVLFSAEHPTNLDEAAYRAFDGSPDTKWLAFENTGWLAYVFPEDRAYAVTSYAITSANDAPERDPDDWTFQGSNDGVNWTILDTQTGAAALWTARNETVTFEIDNTTAYKAYRLDITKASDPSVNMLQISELELFADMAQTLEETWTHVMTTFDGSNATLYINGVPITTRGFSFASDTEANIVFGAGQLNPAPGDTHVGSVPYAGNMFNGALDEIYIYNYALSPQEATNLYLQAAPTIPGGAYCGGDVYPEYDLNDDCIVGVEDLLMFVTEWMVDNQAQ